MNIYRSFGNLIRGDRGCWPSRPSRGNRFFPAIKIDRGTRVLNQTLETRAVGGKIGSLRPFKGPPFPDAPFSFENDVPCPFVTRKRRDVIRAIEARGKVLLLHFASPGRRRYVWQPFEPPRYRNRRGAVSEIHSLGYLRAAPRKTECTRS